jgi:hypothetical protein
VIIQNAVEFPDGSLLYSRHRHDFVSKNGVTLDGGLDYYKSSEVEGVKYKSLCLDEISTMDDILKHLICEATHIKWSNMGSSEIQEVRKTLLNKYMGEPYKGEFSQHTNHHLLLHLYVGGYWLVQNVKNKSLLKGIIDEN